MNASVLQTIKAQQNFTLLPTERLKKLQPLIQAIQNKVNQHKTIRLNFICTHNSRRSHLAQVWAQTAAAYYKIEPITCFSGGTVATALHPKIIKTLESQGFDVYKNIEAENPIYFIKFDANALPIIGFSKPIQHPFNPESNFIAVLTCNDADQNCPIVFGADARIALTYQDPKVADGQPNQTEVYLQRSQQIATEMLYVFSQIKMP
ncbi:protein-tyrosine-phosphatase [Flavobacterium agricola]|uniref:Protein-tyrosine-phosphatase n=1 Tax=Flavobacterium agricola TaxID=2870839 RepID=A0ABY6LZX4_9FLAO|nr:protein-tyrosine-phosphatase [Flavobacterium agricola]UYW00969.1 protein-tyrosine-phosphatase [Flavobacterium agricola]